MNKLAQIKLSKSKKPSLKTHKADVVNIQSESELNADVELEGDPLKRRTKELMEGVDNPVHKTIEKIEH
jgi:Ulp1 family protease